MNPAKKIIKEGVEMCIDVFSSEWENKENREKIKDRVLDPLIYCIMDTIYPYFIISFVIILILFIIMTIILYILLKNNSTISKIKSI